MRSTRLRGCPAPPVRPPRRRRLAPTSPGRSRCSVPPGIERSWRDSRHRRPGRDHRLGRARRSRRTQPRPSRRQSIRGETARSCSCRRPARAQSGYREGPPAERRYRPRTSTAPTRSLLAAVSYRSSSSSNPGCQHPGHLLPRKGTWTQVPLSHKSVECGPNQLGVQVRVGLGWPLTAGDPSLDELLQTPLGLRLGGSDPLCDSVDVRPLGPHFYQDPAEVRLLTDVGADGDDDRLQRPARRPRPEITEPGERSIDPRYEPAVPRVVELLKQSLFAFEVHI